jgi:pentatricopeptide repeat protein
LAEGSITSPAQFRLEFEKLQCRSGQLARVATLEAVFSTFLRSAEPSQWAWLSGQLGHMLAAIADAGPSAFHHDVPDFGNSIRAYCLAVLGQEQEARAILDREGFRSRVAVDHGLRSLVSLELGDGERAKVEMIKTIRRGITGSGQFLTPTLVDCMERFVTRASDEDFLEVMRKAQGLLRQMLLDSTTRSKNPRLEQLWSDRIKSVPASLTVANNSTPGRLIHRFHWLAIAGLFTHCRDALELFKQSKHQDDLHHVRISDAFALFRNLLALGETEEAIEVLKTIHSVHTMSHEQLSPILYHLAKVEGTDGTAVEYLWDLISSSFEPTETDRIVVAKSRARLGKLEATIEVMPDNPTEESVLYAKQRALLMASIKSRDVDSAERYLEAASAIKPTVKDHKHVIRLLVQLNECDRALKVYRGLRDHGLEPDRYIYTSLLSMYARLRDPESARELLRSMLDAGVEPDGVTWGTMVNVYVESGAWESVAELWTEIPAEHRQHDSVLANYMKGLVLQATPYRLVMQMFQQISKPTAYHWALVLQSASDNGHLDTMDSVFRDMQHAAYDSPDAAQPTVYTWSILLHACLRRNLVQRSQTIYDEMLSTGIVPTSATYSMIIQSYARSKSQQSLERAEEFAMSIHRLVNANGSDSSAPLAAERSTRGGTNENLIGPLINAAARSGSPGRAAEYFDLVTENQKPSIPLFTQYLDAWRRAQDVSMVKYVWTELFALACQTIAKRPVASIRTTGPSRTPANALCIPLSIVLITFGKERRLMDIKETWNSVRSAGFGFDGHNFNHLAVSLAQSGDVEGAFDIVENVLLETEAAGEAGSGAIDKSGLVSMSADPVNPVDTPFRPPNRRAIYQPGEEVTGALEVDLPPLDIVTPSSAHDAVWRPQFHTLATLDTLVSDLENAQSNRAWMGLAMSEEAEEDAEGEGGVVMLNQLDTCVRDPNDGAPKKTNAKGLLMRLNRKYSKAMALVMFHRKKQGDLAKRKAGAAASRELRGGGGKPQAVTLEQ